MAFALYNLLTCAWLQVCIFGGLIAVHATLVNLHEASICMLYNWYYISVSNLHVESMEYQATLQQHIAFFSEAGHKLSFLYLCFAFTLPSTQCFVYCVLLCVLVRIIGWCVCPYSLLAMCDHIISLPLSL